MNMTFKGNALKALKKIIQSNCDISDAQGSGIFSICGMALRLRDLNKWEKGFKPWEENDPGKLIDWIDRKEQKWETIEGQAFAPLTLLDQLYDPFDTVEINSILEPYGLFYGAGYAHSLKPTFFLAHIEETYKLAGIKIVALEKELIRDLLTIPALNQDNTIIIRRDAARIFLWDQMIYLKKSGQRYLHFALTQCGLPDTGIESRKNHFESILSVQEQTYIYHEIGEITETDLDHQTFRELVSLFPNSTVELITRTVKDLLADTGPHGPLQYIISTKNTAGLAFYVAFQDGLFKPMFPQLRAVFEKFASDRDWEGIEHTRQKGYAMARQYALDIVDIYNSASDKKSMDQVADQINNTLVQPLIDRS